MLHLILMLNTMKILMKKIPNLKLVIVFGFQNTKTFLLKYKLKIGLKILLLAKSKTLFRGLISNVNGEPITGSFYEKELKKLVKKNSELKK